MESRGDSMGDWKPALIPGIDLRGLPLTPEEGFIASRLDGNTDLHGIAQVTGLARESIGAVLEKLVSHGAVAPQAPAPAAAPETAVEPDEAAALAEPPAAGEGIHRKLYETSLRELTSEARVARARGAIDPELSALCFDPL